MTFVLNTKFPILLPFLFCFSHIVIPMGGEKISMELHIFSPQKRNSLYKRSSSIDFFIAVLNFQGHKKDCFRRYDHKTSHRLNDQFHVGIRLPHIPLIEE